MKIRTQQGETVDSLCYRYYGKTQGVTEQVLVANPNLASLGLVLPYGILLEMPDLIEPTHTDTVQLWD